MDNYMEYVREVCGNKGSYSEEDIAEAMHVFFVEKVSDVVSDEEWDILMVPQDDVDALADELGITVEELAIRYGAIADRLCEKFEVLRDWFGDGDDWNDEEGDC